MRPLKVRLQAEALANILLDTQLVPVCTYCEREKGPARLEPGQHASHGYCKRHRAVIYMNPPFKLEPEAAMAKAEKSDHGTVYWHDTH